MRKALFFFLFVINFFIMLPFIMIWTLAGYISTAIYSLMEILDG